MAPELEWLVDQPTQFKPVMVMALEGLFDAADAATTAVRLMKESAPSIEPLARIDPEGFFNFQDRRPEVRLDDNGKRVIDWPVTEVDAVERYGAKHPMVVVGRRGTPPAVADLRRPPG